MGFWQRVKEYFSIKIPGETQGKSPHSNYGSSQTKYVAFDLEIAKILPGDFSAWRAHRPLGITCAAVLFDGLDPVLWYSKSENGSIAAKMNQEDLIRLVEYLRAAVEKGWQLITWNGLGFDLNVLAEESGCLEECRKLALTHTDMMFHIFCEKGFPLSLDKAAKGMGLSGKTAGMTGELAPVLWQQRKFQEVLVYVKQDVYTTLGVAKAGIRAGKISWTSNKGNRQHVMLPDGWLQVEQALLKPLPDNSWMSQPLSRDEFWSWTRNTKPVYPTKPVKSNPVHRHIPQSIRRSKPANKYPPIEELSIDEINAILAEGDNYSDNYPPSEFRKSRRIDALVPCECPICMGTPHLDLRFSDTVEDDRDDYYDNDYNE